MCRRTTMFPLKSLVVIITVVVVRLKERRTYRPVGKETHRHPSVTQT